jgi:hypothetical protein
LVEAANDGETAPTTTRAVTPTAASNLDTVFFLIVMICLLL